MSQAPSSVQSTATLALNGNDLTLEGVEAVAYHGQPVSLDELAMPGILASRKVIDDILAEGRTVYGVTTGFGALSQVTIPVDSVNQLQVNLVRSHAAGTGSFLDEPTTRAMMLLRANTLAKGFSGVRPEVIQTLIEMLNRQVCPRIPSQGSLGASGDLAPLAHLALVLMGEGEALYQGSCLPGGEAMERAGIPTLSLQAKEGLALLNGTQMMSALGVLSLLKAERLMKLAEVAGAMTIEAVRGSLRPFDDRVAQVRPHPGHVASAATFRQLLANSEILESHKNCAKVQDPYSLRCIPQVHGAVREVLGRVRNVLSVEINAATDNPLVFPDGLVVSQGNFHGEPVSMALDTLGIALTELASIAERRIDKLMNPTFSDLPAFLAGEKQAGLNSGFMIVHYTAASLVSECKILSHPAVVDSIPTSNDKEDHVSMGATAARKAAKILEHVRWVVAAELLAAAQGLEHREGLHPGEGVWAAYQLIRQHVTPLESDRVLATDVETVARLLDAGTLLSSVEQAVGPLPTTEIC